MTEEILEFRRSGVDAMDVHFRLDANAGTGTFGGYASLWDRRDSYGTFMLVSRNGAGTWARGGLADGYALQDMHSVESFTRDTLGMQRFIEDDRGLQIEKGDFAPTRPGQDARALAHLAQEYGVPAQLSVGFVRLMMANDDPEVDSEDPNGISVAKLKEVSMIIPHFASLAGAEMASVRSQAVTTQADVLRALTDSENLLEPKAEARIIDLMTDRNGRKRSLVVRVGFEAEEEDDAADEKDAPPEVDVPGKVETEDEHADSLATGDAQDDDSADGAAETDDSDGEEDDDERKKQEALTDADAPSQADVAKMADLTDDDLTGEPLPSDDKASRADAKPGDGNAAKLREYWVAGKGRTKWSTWTELYHHLRKYIKNPEIAKATAAKWYHLATGHWAGEKHNHAAEVSREQRALEMRVKLAKAKIAV